MIVSNTILFRNLLSIPWLLTISGVGEKTAIGLLTLFKTYQGTNRAQITALAGLDPVKRESGTSVKGKVKISKNGKGIYRKIFYYLPFVQRFIIRE